MNRLNSETSIKPSYRAMSGVASYDASAHWLLPPPKISFALSCESGIDVVRQSGHACAADGIQEVLVEAPEPSVLLMSEGSDSIEWHVNGRRHQTAGGASVTRMAPGKSRFVCRPTSADVIHVLFRPPVFSKLAPDLGETCLLNRVEPADPGLTRLIQVFSLDIDQGRQDPMLIETYVMLFLRRLVSTSRTPAAKGRLAPWQVRRTTEYLHAHLDEAVSITTLAALVDLSPFHFSRAFKQSLGTPPYAFHCALRLAEAKRLLIETDLPVTEIALSVGYEAPQTLARVFQREVGQSPTAFRRERRS